MQTDKTEGWVEAIAPATGNKKFNNIESKFWALRTKFFKWFKSGY